MTCYPVIIPTLNRYEHFKNCVESLSKNLLANETELIIGLDYPPSEKYEEGWKKIKEYIPTITGFKKVTCIERTENFGAEENSNDLVQLVFSSYDAYIYSEDDNIFSPYFLDFINSGLEKYKDDKSIFAICGYSYPIDWKTDKYCVLQKQYFSAWGYGGWKEKEEIFNKEINDNYFLRNFYRKDIKSILQKSPSNFIGFMNYAFYEKIPSYDISRSFYMLLNNYYVVMPKKTLVTNDGWDGSGEHCLEKTYIDFSNPDRNENMPIEISDMNIIYSNELEKAIFSLKTKTDFVKAKIKFYLIKFFGLNTIRKISFFIKKKV